MKKELLLKEDEAAQQADTPENPVALTTQNQLSRPAKDSVDDQIDALLLRYEKSSVREKSAISIDESLKSLNLKFLIEQEEEADEIEAPDADTDTDTDTGDEAQDPSGSEDMTVSEPEDDVLVPDLDIDEFTNRVVRLVSNYENLLRVEEAVINRAKNFLDENYGDVFVNAFLENLRDKFGLETDEFADEDDRVDDDKYAVGAFAGGTGAPAGG
tara:strand:- start:530 stop:1171 length:642 start_codon:yes stop_codon:yes gene_type:complete